MPPKTLFASFAFLTLGLACARATSLAYREVTIAGENYLQSLDTDDFTAAPKWKFGDGEPPVLPNRAATLATAVFSKQFGGVVRAELWRVDLQRVFGTDCVYYEIVFLEQLTAEESRKRERVVRSDASTTVAEVPIANIRYFVLLDGRVIGPKKKA